MRCVRLILIFILSLVSLVFLITVLPVLLNPTPPTPEEKQRDDDWIATSPYWLDRQACRWLSLCGVHHLRWDAPARSPDQQSNRNDDKGDLRRIELRRRAAPSLTWPLDHEQMTTGPEEIWRSNATVLQDIPDYVLRHAPLVHLYSGEQFWPSDIAEHVQHMKAMLNRSPMDLRDPVDLGNLGDIDRGDLPVILTSKDNVEDRPDWLHSHENIPSPFEPSRGDERPGPEEQNGGETAGRADTSRTTWYYVDKEHPLRRISEPRNLAGRRQSQSFQRRHVFPASGQQTPMPPPLTPTHKPHVNGYSKAPAVLVIVDKGSGIVDAFWFFFYSYNLGQTVLKIRFGNHVGDWEHAMVRFENGIPRALFLSAHAGGQAYAWDALEKLVDEGDGDGDDSRRVVKSRGERPILYSAVGSHAMYATPGSHAYVLPFGLLADVTDKGPLWDPAKNTYAYFYDYEAARPKDGHGSPPSAAADQALPSSRRKRPVRRTPRSHPVPSANERRGAAAVADLADGRTGLVPAATNPHAPTSWFHFGGAWGDETYGLGDSRQWRLFGQYHYITGPRGPKFKNLGRTQVCQTERCRIFQSVEEGMKSTWYG